MSELSLWYLNSFFNKPILRTSLQINFIGLWQIDQFESHRSTKSPISFGGCSATAALCYCLFVNGSESTLKTGFIQRLKNLTQNILQNREFIFKPLCIILFYFKTIANLLSVEKTFAICRYCVLRSHFCQLVSFINV